MNFTSTNVIHTMKTKQCLTFYLFLASALVLLWVPGCDLFTAPGQDGLREKMKKRVQERREQWEEQGIENYQLKYSQQIGETRVDSVSVHVQDGAVDSVLVSSTVSRDELLVGTVDSFFDLIESRLGEPESQFSADFDQNLGFPTSYTADFLDGRPSQTVVTLALRDSTGGSYFDQK